MHTWNVCRLCLNAVNLNPIFPIPEEHVKYTNIILECCGIQVLFNDGLPQHICTSCVTTINDNYKFRKKCTETQKIIESHLKNHILIKTEYEFDTEGSVFIDISDFASDESGIDSRNIIGDTKISNINENGYCVPIEFEIDEDNTKCKNKLFKNNFIDKFDYVKETGIDENKARVANEGVCKQNDLNKIGSDIQAFENENNANDTVKRRSKRVIKEKIDDTLKLDDLICEDDMDYVLLGNDNELDTQIIEKLPKLSKNLKREKRETKKPKNRREKESKKEMKEPVECEYCHKKLSSKLSIPNHYKIHTGFNIVCEHCGKKFISRRILLMHCRARHGYEKTDKCRYCDYKASNADQVKIHERLHTGEKPFVCQECGAAFIRSSTYKQHAATHLTDKNVKCDQCPALFKSVTLMKIHKNKHKPNQYVFKCRVCNNSFVRRRNVTRHLERIHKMQPEPGLLERVRIGASDLDKT